MRRNGTRSQTIRDYTSWKHMHHYNEGDSMEKKISEV